MKILPVIYSQNTLNKNSSVRYDREIMQDTFKKTSSPSFGHNEAIVKAAQEVINNPGAMQKYTKYMTEAFLFLLGMAGLTEIKQNNSANNITQEKLLAEISRLKLENQQLREKSGLTPNEENADEQPAQNTANTATPAVHKHRCVHVKFPKKNAGKLSEGQKQLKSIAEKLRLSKDECAKLTAVCAKSLEKKIYVVDGKKTDNSKLAMCLAKELQENMKEPEAVINKYYELFGLKDTETSAQTNGSNTDTEEKTERTIPEQTTEDTTKKSAEKTPSEQTTEDTAEKTTEATPSEQTTEDTAKKSAEKTPSKQTTEDTSEAKTDNVPSEQTTSVTDDKGKPNPTDNPPKRSRVYTPPVSGQIIDPLGTCHIEISPYQIDPSELHAKGQNVVLIDPKSDVYSYYDRLAFEHNVYTIFQNMQRKFENAVFKDKRNTQRVSWIATKGTAYKVTDSAVENAIKCLIGESACEHLTTENTSDVADAINADRRFGEYFRLHAAIRLIDRFANFDDPDTSLEEQCHEMLDCFENIVKRAFHNRINIKLYADDNGDFGERVAISPSSYYEEDKKYFKDKPLILGLGKIYTPSKSDRPPIIITIYNDNNQ